MAQTKEERRLAAKRHRLWVLYRTTLEEQNKVEDYMQSSPEFRILLTKGDPKEKANLYTDHDHVTGLFRGRLAYLINKGLGTIEGVYKERTPAVLRALARYLDSPPSTEMGIVNYGLIGRAKINKKKKVYGPPTKKASKR